jgi:molybdate/tungstate transport system ATP-binding protein
MLELTDLTSSVPGFGLGPIDLAVDDEVLAVLGPSGSGKTTLLSLVAGILEPDAGSIALDDRELVGVPLEDRGTGLVFQDGALFPHMTARENVAYAATDARVVDELAAVLEIETVLDRRPTALSGGERQRVALARTLAADPDALLLDEPLSSLDAPIRRRLRDELHDLFGDLAIPVVYVTHDQRTAVSLGDRLAIVRDGGIEQLGPPNAVVDRPSTAFAARFTGTENVFDATVVDTSGDGSAISIGDVVCHVDAQLSVGTTVTACIHPSRVQLDDWESQAARTPMDGEASGPELSAADGEASWHETSTADASRPPDIDRPGIVQRAMHEGDRHRVVVSVDGLPTALTATLALPTAADVSVTAGSPVHVTVPRDGIHVIE